MHEQGDIKCSAFDPDVADTGKKLERGLHNKLFSTNVKVVRVVHVVRGLTKAKPAFITTLSR